MNSLCCSVQGQHLYAKGRAASMLPGSLQLSTHNTTSIAQFPVLNGKTHDKLWNNVELLEVKIVGRF